MSDLDQRRRTVRVLAEDERQMAALLPFLRAARSG